MFLLCHPFYHPYLGVATCKTPGSTSFPQTTHFISKILPQTTCTTNIFVLLGASALLCSLSDCTQDNRLITLATSNKSYVHATRKDYCISLLTRLATHASVLDTHVTGLSCWFATSVLNKPLGPPADILPQESKLPGHSRGQPASLSVHADHKFQNTHYLPINCNHDPSHYDLQGDMLLADCLKLQAGELTMTSKYQAGRTAELVFPSCDTSALNRLCTRTRNQPRAQDGTSLNGWSSSTMAATSWWT